MCSVARCGDCDIGVVAMLITPIATYFVGFFFSSRRRHTRCLSDWSSDVCSSDLLLKPPHHRGELLPGDAVDDGRVIPEPVESLLCVANVTAGAPGTRRRSGRI